MAVNVDGLTCYLHYPMVCDHQMRGESFLFGAALSYHVTVGGVTFPGGAKPPGLNI
jgi:hypothetical protein